MMTMKVSKGLEFPVVALPGAGHMPAAGEGEDEEDAAQVFYVAATRSTQRLVMGVGGNGWFVRKLVYLQLGKFRITPLADVRHLAWSINRHQVVYGSAAPGDQ
ncbi:3'-5' exonuclease [Rhodoferax sp.]|uniref:3'-5' exonuclease n=1 Tax=Rhodoferax sp. TaxID=50421 RepID=UPI003A100D5C